MQQEATQALQLLITAVVRAVQDVDIEVDIHAILGSLTLTTHGPGQFGLVVESAAAIDSAALAAALQPVLTGEDSDVGVPC